MKYWLPFFAALTGCIGDSAIDPQFGDIHAGPVVPLMAQGVVLDVEIPDDDVLRELVEAASFESGTDISVFLNDPVTRRQRCQAPTWRWSSTASQTARRSPA